jgi:hypothetical protein
MANRCTRHTRPRLKRALRRGLRARLKDELGLSSVMQVPGIEKVTLNMGVGEAKTDAKQLDSAIEELTIIAGPARAGAQGPEVDRRLQDPRRDADRRARDAARIQDVGLPSTG